MGDGHLPLALLSAFSFSYASFFVNKKATWLNMSPISSLYRWISRGSERIKEFIERA
jgi:hypothetical protein